ncbi:hypothetical protein THTE_0995 [Thermogutta terrifontis]|uniref:Uncharacterized protein n=1 Tax=Thermogutta terrifontis TaxID=1331910 RepID=A0A286RCF7_9BACT|nr:hypothetical protein THTE_0995 [Thermogutta terrifontis]
MSRPLFPPGPARYVLSANLWDPSRFIELWTTHSGIETLVE